MCLVCADNSSNGSQTSDSYNSEISGGIIYDNSVKNTASFVEGTIKWSETTIDYAIASNSNTTSFFTANGQDYNSYAWT